MKCKVETVLAAEFQEAQPKEENGGDGIAQIDGGQGKTQTPTPDKFITVTTRTSECDKNARGKLMQAWFILSQSSQGSSFVQIQSFQRRSFCCHFLQHHSSHHSKETGKFSLPLSICFPLSHSYMDADKLILPLPLTQFPTIILLTQTTSFSIDRQI
jgi:hypothetical protein